MTSETKPIRSTGMSVWFYITFHLIFGHIVTVLEAMVLASNFIVLPRKNVTLQRTPVNLICLVQEKNIIISGLSDYPVLCFIDDLYGLEWSWYTIKGVLNILCINVT